MLLVLILYLYIAWRFLQRGAAELQKNPGTRIYKDASLEEVPESEVGPEELRLLAAAAQQLEPLGFQPGRLFRIVNNRNLIARSWVKPGEPSYGAQFLVRQMQPPRVLVQQIFAWRCHLQDGREIATGFSPMPSFMPKLPWVLSDEVQPTRDLVAVLRRQQARVARFPTEQLIVRSEAEIFAQIPEETRQRHRYWLEHGWIADTAGDYYVMTRKLGRKASLKMLIPWPRSAVLTRLALYLLLFPPPILLYSRLVAAPLPAYALPLLFPYFFGGISGTLAGIILDLTSVAAAPYTLLAGYLLAIGSGVGSQSIRVATAAMLGGWLGVWLKRNVGAFKNLA